MQFSEFKSPDGNELHATMIDDAPWFVAADVCAALGYTNTSKALGDHVRERHQSTITIRYSGRRTTNKAIVSEAGLYSLIMRSRKSEAETFQDWVTESVLPAIRERGEYRTENAPQLPDFADPGAAARAWADQYDGRQKAEKQLEKQKPAIDFARSVMFDRDDRYTVGEVAKIIGTGRNRLFDWLREQNWIMDDRTPYQRVIEAGYLDFRFSMSETMTFDLDNAKRLQVLVTGKGLAKIERMHAQAQNDAGAK